jgi:hypothetical protein
MNDANTNTTPTDATTNGYINADPTTTDTNAATTTDYTNADPTTTDPNAILATLLATHPEFATAFTNLIQHHTPPILINPTSTTPTNAPPPLPTNLPTASVLFHQPPKMAYDRTSRDDHLAQPQPPFRPYHHD